MKPLQSLIRLFKRQGRDWEGLLQALKSSPDARIRWEAAEALAGSPPRPEIVSVLIESLGDPHPFVRWKAGEALLSMGREEVSHRLLELLDGKDVNLRAEVAQILGRLRSLEAVAGLSKALRSRSELVRWSAAEALLSIGTKEAVEHLKKALDDPAWGVRRAAAIAFGKRLIPKEEALPLLAELVKDPHPAVRSAAARAMGKLRAPEAEPFLLPLLSDPHPQVRAEAALALGWAGGDNAIAHLKRLLGDYETVFGETIASKAKQAINLIKRRKLLKALRITGA